MSNNSFLKYKPADKNPTDRVRIYFCCHEDDFLNFFEPITEEILKHQNNATIWYYDPKEGKPSPQDEEFLAALSQMQMFVVPITSNFLKKKNQARIAEFRYAIDNHIPVLPLMQETGIENDFNLICGDLQLLDKYTLSKDTTAIPYEEKLRKFLESVLVDDELGRKIRDAFDAYIFLSYRKKDRKYAQEIMRLIHDNDFCRDIAIWYDEFLTPGENFTIAIEEAMKKSKLFAMVVTPSLLEQGNYVMTTEYPRAKNAGMNILPIEGVKTADDQLAESYIGIDPTATHDDIKERLHDAVMRMALEEKEENPAHTFLIGLAYLSGIDVETNHERALELIEKAADADLPEAYKKLTTMYQKGEGVKINYSTAIIWQEKYVNYLRDQHKSDQDDDSLKQLVEETKNLGDYQRINKDYSSAYDSYMECLNMINAHFGSRNDYEEMVVDAYIALGMICRVLKRFDEAMEWLLKAKSICEPLRSSHESLKVLAFLSRVYENIGLIYEKTGNNAEAKENYIKSALCIETILEKQYAECYMDFTVACDKIEMVCQNSDEAEAVKWHVKKIRIMELPEAQTRILKSPFYLLDEYAHLQLYFKENSDDALYWRKKCEDVVAVYMADSKQNKLERLPRRLEYFGVMFKEKGRFEEAEEWQSRANRVRMII